MADPAAAPVLVDPTISLTKVAAEVAAWRANDAVFRRRGLLLTRHNGLEVDLLVLAPAVPLPLAAAGVRLRFDNYDLWPPSLVFTDPMTGEPLAPRVMPTAVAVDAREDPPRRLVLLHPDTERAFMCLPGIREYHSHPEHTGDHWLLYRGKNGVGTLHNIATTLHQRIGATARLALLTRVVLHPDAAEVDFDMRMGFGRPPVAPSQGEDLPAAAAEIADPDGARIEP